MSRALLLLAVTSLLRAQALNPEVLLKDASEQWPTYNGDYTGRRYSVLSQINRDNVHSLTMAWSFQTHSAGLKGTPLEVDGVVYFTAPDNVWALDL